MSQLLDALRQKYACYFAPDAPVKIDVGEGWYVILDVLFQRLDTLMIEAPQASLKIAQIKEKCGYLKIFYGVGGFASDELRFKIKQSIELAMKASTQCCDQCAGIGSLIKEPPWRVRCNECGNKRTSR